MSTLRDIMSTSRGHHDECGGGGGYHEYQSGDSIHWGDTMSTSEDVQYIRGYHDACGGAS